METTLLMDDVEDEDLARVSSNEDAVVEFIEDGQLMLDKNDKVVDQQDRDGNGMNYDDIFLPAATVVKIIKDVLPDKTVISKEVKDMAKRIAAYFVLYITDCALEQASKRKKKAIMVEDVMSALTDTDFADMVAVLNGLLAQRKSRTGDKVAGIAVDYMDKLDVSEED